MSKLFRHFVVLCMAIIMAFSITVVSYAEETDPKESIAIVTISDDDDGSKAYQLVWKYKYGNGHLYKRRWNNTLGQWYDPDWILVK